MKRAASLLFLAALVLVVAVSIAAADDTVRIWPHVFQNGDVVPVGSGQTILIREGWLACTRGLTEAFRRASVVGMTVNDGSGSPLTIGPPGSEYWTPVTAFGTDAETCVMHTGSLWRTDWTYPLGVLPDGEYQVHFLWYTTSPVPDGGDYDGDGRPDVGHYYMEREFTIDVG